MIAAIHFSSSFRPGRRRPKASGQTTEAQKRAIDDTELVKRFKAGDESAFLEIMTRYQSRMYAIALANLRNHADAEEIVQDTFIRAHRALAKFRGESSLATWLYRIALNLSRNRYWYYFRRCRHANLSFDVALSESNQATLAELVATDAAGPAREAAASEFSELITVCMAQLDAQPREILTLRNTRNLTYGAIARKLGISIGTVKSRIARARMRLLVLLSEACPELGANAGPEAWFDPIRPASGVILSCA